MSVRDAVPSDADEVGRIQLTTWRTAYSGLVPDEILAGLSAAEHRERWASRLPAAPGAFCLVAGSPPVGFVSGGHLGDGAEIYALYVEPPAWRRGVGRALLAAGVARLRDAGATTAGLWVLRDNVPARSFYESQGWAPTGEARLEPMYGIDLPVVRYATRLDAPRDAPRDAP